MQKIKLNKDFGQIVEAHEYKLDAKKEYIINMQDEIEEQAGIVQSVQTMGLLALKDYYNWLSKNGFDVNMPNPTNKSVSPYYGSEPLWCTDLSQGIVVKAESEDDYYIVMECSRLNEGFKYTQIILTLGGCL